MYVYLFIYLFKYINLKKQINMVYVYVRLLVKEINIYNNLFYYIFLKTL